MTPENELFNLILDLRNALAAAMRVLVKNEGATEDFVAEVHQIGIKDGVGQRADEWLKENDPQS